MVLSKGAIIGIAVAVPIAVVTVVVLLVVFLVVLKSDDSTGTATPTPLPIVIDCDPGSTMLNNSNVAYREYVGATGTGVTTLYVPQKTIILTGGALGNPSWYSTDGNTWQLNANLNSQSPGALAATFGYSPTLDRIVSLNVNGSTTFPRTSTDGITWTTHPQVDDTWLILSPKNGWIDRFGLFVAINDRNTASTQRIATSPDGINWTLRTTPSMFGLRDIVDNGEIVIATSGNGTIYSTDLVNWTKSSDLTTGPCAWSPVLQTFMILSSPNDSVSKIYNSSDGKTFTEVASEEGNRRSRMLVWVDAYCQFVFGGDRFGAEPHFGVSSDGRTLTKLDGTINGDTYGGAYVGLTNRFYFGFNSNNAMQSLELVA